MRRDALAARTGMDTLLGNPGLWGSLEEGFEQLRREHASAYILHHAAGPLAVCHASIRVDTIQDAIVYGTEGHIRLHRPWWRATGLTVCRRGRAEESIDLGLKGQGYTHEAEEVARCLRAGVLESEHMTWKESLSIMRTMDELRAQWGLRYPTER